MQAPATRAGFAPRLAAIAATGLAVRLVYVLALTRGLRDHGDSAYYHGLANLLANGNGFVDPTFGTATAQHPPLFTLFLALPSLLGLHSYLAHRAAVTLIGAGTIVVVGLLARRVAGERAGLIAAAVAAAYPVLVSSDGAAMSETLLGLLAILCAAAAYRLLERPSAARGAALGALVGLAAMTRGEAILLVLLLGVPLALRLRRRGRLALGVAALACAVVLTPWTVRNLTTFDRPVLLSTNDGSLLAGANCQRTYRGRDIGSWDLRCVPTKFAPDESVAAARARRQGLDYARDHAGRVSLVLAARLGRTFGVLQPARQAQHAEGRAPGLELAGTVVFLLLVPLGVYGVLVLRRCDVPRWPLLAPFGLAVAATVAGYGVPRFRVPADVALTVLAGVALDRLLRRRAQAPREAGAGPAGAGSAVASPRSDVSGARASRLSRSAGRSTR